MVHLPGVLASAKWGGPGVVAAGFALLGDVDPSITIAVVGGVQAAAIGYFGLRQQQAESEGDHTAWLVDQLQTQLEDEQHRSEKNRLDLQTVQVEIATLRRKMGSLLIGSDRLVAQIEASGDIPVWRPPLEES